VAVFIGLYISLYHAKPNGHPFSESRRNRNWYCAAAHRLLTCILSTGPPGLMLTLAVRGAAAGSDSFARAPWEMKLILVMGAAGKATVSGHGRGK